MALKTRYKSHMNRDGKAMYYTAEYKFLFKWLPYKVYIRRYGFIRNFDSLEEVKTFIDEEQSNYDKRMKNKVVKTSTTTYP